MEFQITQNYKHGCKGFIYFEVNEVNPNIDSLKKTAKEEMIKDWQKINPALYFSEPEKPKPTIQVAEYKRGIGKIKDGIRFKCKWR